jgi:hypothetical protein
VPLVTAPGRDSIEQSPRVTASFVPAHAPGAVAVDADGEAVVVDEATGQLHLLNTIGALLWNCFDGNSSLAEICADFAAELDAPFELVLGDTVAAVGTMVGDGILVDARAFGSEPRLADEPASEPDDGPRVLPEPPSP